MSAPERQSDQAANLAGDLDDDVLSALGRDVRLGDTGRVDALTDDGRRLVQLLLRGRCPVLRLRAEDDLGAALEIERELRGPGARGLAVAVLEDVHAQRVDSEEHARHEEQAEEDPPGVADGRG